MSLPVCNAYDPTDRSVQVYKTMGNMDWLKAGLGVFGSTWLIFLCLVSFGYGGWVAYGCLFIALGGIGLAIAGLYQDGTSTKECVRNPDI